MSELRDHGYGTSPEVEGAPTVLSDTDQVCPKCKCSVYVVQVILKSPPEMLKVPQNYRAVGRYLGCPACPWAGPMFSGQLMAGYRFVICVDIEATTLTGAYSALYDGMKGAVFSEHWESTDEAYDPDGRPVSSEDIQHARMAKFAKKAT